MPWWTAYERLRTTVPFATYAHRPLSVAERKQDVKTRRAATAAAKAAPRVSRSVKALRDAARGLVQQGQVTFTGNTLLDETIRQEPGLRRETLRNALAGELSRPHALIVRAEELPAHHRSEASRPPDGGRVARETLMLAEASVKAAEARPGADGRLCGEVVLDAVHHLTSPSYPRWHEAGVSIPELARHLNDAGHYYEPSGLYRAVRRAREAGLVELVQRQPLRVRANASDPAPREPQ